MAQITTKRILVLTIAVFVAIVLMYNIHTHPLHHSDYVYTAKFTHISSDPTDSSLSDVARNLSQTNITLADLKTKVWLSSTTLSDSSQVSQSKHDSDKLQSSGRGMPFMGDYENCVDRLCSQFLTAEDLERERFCLVTKRHRLKDIEHLFDLTNPEIARLWPGTCHFMNGTNRGSIALTSFPGSGNTWTRGLLEQATGICTGSVYHDMSLRLGGQHGESIISGTVLAVKDHGHRWDGYQGAILVVRNPLNALVAEYQRGVLKQGHTGTAKQEDFLDNKQWEAYVKRQSKGWQNRLTSFVTSKPTAKRLLVVRFEDLKLDVLGPVKRMLDFLGVPYSDDKLEERMSINYQTFKRKKGGPKLEYYTPAQRRYVLDAVRATLQTLKSHHNDTYGIEDYLE